MPELLPETYFPVKFGEERERGRCWNQLVAKVIISSVFRRLKNQCEFVQQRGHLEMGSAFSADLRLKRGVTVFLQRSSGCLKSPGT